MPYANQEQLLQHLIDTGKVQADIAATVRLSATERQEPVEAVLIADRLVSDRDVAAAKATLLNMPFFDITGSEIPRDTLQFIPQEVAEHYQLLAITKKGSELQVGLLEPQDFKALEAVEFLAQKSKLTVRYGVIAPSAFRQAIKRYQELGEEVQEALSNVGGEFFGDLSDTDQAKKMEQVIKSAPVSKMVLVIVRHAVDGRASDIHIEPSRNDTKVRYRIDGMLRTSLVLPHYIHSAIVARIKVLANLRLDETRKPQDGRIRLTIDDKDIDLRVSTLPLVDGEKIVLRVLDSANTVPTLEQLGLTDAHIQAIKRGIEKPHGLLLLTGPTGSGKTTTLYTILTMVNKDQVNIVTLEDPIEYFIGGVNQSQINPEVGYSFASGLRAMLRQDPNVIMLGEIRDEETTQLVVHASLTGHMVMSTLHTNSAIGAIPRLLDLGAEPFLLSSVLNLVIAQRLARKICNDCKKPMDIPERLRQSVAQQYEQIPADLRGDLPATLTQLWKGAGCGRCGGSGYRGRVAVAEVIEVTPAISEIINRGAAVDEMTKELAKQRFITLTQDCLLKAAQGVTTLEEVIRVSQL